MNPGCPQANGGACEGNAPQARQSQLQWNGLWKLLMGQCSLTVLSGGVALISYAANQSGCSVTVLFCTLKTPVNQQSHRE